MNCSDCGHWQQPDDLGWPIKGEGDCTLMPKWFRTDADHFCGQWEERRRWGKTPAVANYHYARARADRAEEHRQRERAVAAEKKLKELRAGLRKLKGKAP